MALSPFGPRVMFPAATTDAPVRLPISTMSSAVSRDASSRPARTRTARTWVGGTTSTSEEWKSLAAIICGRPSPSQASEVSVLATQMDATARVGLAAPDTPRAEPDAAPRCAMMKAITARMTPAALPRSV
jgi:hypothetical protein